MLFPYHPNASSLYKIIRPIILGLHPNKRLKLWTKKMGYLQFDSYFAQPPNRVGKMKNFPTW